VNADQVVTSRKGKRYHVNENCPGWLQGRNNSVHLNRELHDVLEVSEAQAVRMGKLRCKRCGGRS
jgi:hypothetical protein